MKICRVCINHPHDKSPGSGLVPYQLSKYIREPTLHISRKIPANAKRREVPGHVVVKEISYSDRRTPDSMRHELHTEKRQSVGKRILTHLRIIKTMRGVVFLIKSIPALIAFRPDIIACHMNTAILHGVFAKYFLGSVFVFYIHNNSEIVIMKNLWLLRVLVRRADLVFCLTETMGKKLVEAIPSMAGKVRYMSTGVDPTLFNNADVERKNQLIAVGMFRWMKGYKYLLEAMPQVFDKHPEYSLIIAGDGPEKDSIVNQIGELGISSRVKLVGIVSHLRLVQFLNESRVFVMASISEGLPKALLEALACGTPAVITTGCNADELIQGRGLLVEVGNSQALAEAIDKLIEDKALWQRCSINASTITEEYNWENIARKVYDNYRAILHLTSSNLTGQTVHKV